MNFYRFFIISLFLASFLVSTVPVSLAQGAGIEVSPLRIEELVDPGETIQKRIKITNLSNSFKTFYVYLMDFKARGEGGEALLIPAGTEAGPFLTTWIKVTPKEISFAPKEEKEISITIQVPKEVGPGGYYGAVVFGTAPPKVEVEAEKGAAIAIAQQAGVLVLLRVSGKVIEDAIIREFSTDKGFYNPPFRVNFITRVENLGNVHIKPHGIIEIKNMFGKKVATLRVNDPGANVLPKSIRRFGNFWEGEFGFGKYTASLALSFGTFAYEGGQGRQTLYAERSFWILPWKVIVPLFFGLIFVGALFALLLKLYKDRTIKKVLQEAGLRQVRYIRKYEGPSPLLYLSLILIIILILIFLIGGAIFFLFFA